MKVGKEVDTLKSWHCDESPTEDLNRHVVTIRFTDIHKVVLLPLAGRLPGSK